LICARPLLRRISATADAFTREAEIEESGLHEVNNHRELL
jgi:hypothetical protein